jgi:hypothetical protein
MSPDAIMSRVFPRNFFSPLTHNFLQDRKILESTPEEELGKQINRKWISSSWSTDKKLKNNVKKNHSLTFLNREKCASIVVIFIRNCPGDY